MNALNHTMPPLRKGSIGWLYTNALSLFLKPQTYQGVSNCFTEYKYDYIEIPDDYTSLWLLNIAD